MTGIYECNNEVEYAGTQEAMDAARERAVLEGLEIIEGTPSTLLIDLDNGAELNQAMVTKLAEQFGGYSFQQWESRSRCGSHIRITMDVTFTPAQALALESALGSDPLRTILGVKRLQNGVVQPRMLFKPRRQT
jgi:hypothetical protein